MIPKKLGYKETPKRDIYGLPRKGKQVSSYEKIRRGRGEKRLKGEAG